ncbi:MAG: hypothetical protein P4L99_02115 [Chthoniobacter sp.]|nr:hypothetical protein [Chthoniobacter sp.]
MSNPTRNGKIARLPKPIREEINQRLDRGATAHSLIDWLNALPEVQAVVQSEFDGHPVSDQNLSQWRQGGYQDWLRHQEALEVVKILYEHGEELQAEGKERLPVNEVLSLWLSSRFVAATREISALDGEAAWKRQRQFCDDLMKVRRAEHREAQLQLERERVDLHRQEVQIDQERLEMERKARKRAGSRKATGHETYENEPEPDQRWEDISDEAKIAWARKPENLDRISPPMTDEEHIARMKEMFGVS